MNREEMLALAKRLPKGAARACLAMTGDWQFPGRDTFNANGAWSLHWTKGVGGRGQLAEYEARPAGKHKRAAYRLTALGFGLQAALRARAQSPEVKGSPDAH
jgi:hypothetical protein